MDADSAINAMLWQNAGKSGIDQWNFVLFPETASQDPTAGAYTRKWVPPPRASSLANNRIDPSSMASPRRGIGSSWYRAWRPILTGSWRTKNQNARLALRVRWICNEDRRTHTTIVAMTASLFRMGKGLLYSLPRKHIG